MEGGIVMSHLIQERACNEKEMVFRLDVRTFVQRMHAVGSLQRGEFLTENAH
jgi:hypothetical protein